MLLCGVSYLFALVPSAGRSSVGWVSVSRAGPCTRASAAWYGSGGCATQAVYIATIMRAGDKLLTSAAVYETAVSARSVDPTTHGVWTRCMRRAAVDYARRIFTISRTSSLCAPDFSGSER